MIWTIIFLFSMIETQALPSTFEKLDPIPVQDEQLRSIISIEHQSNERIFLLDLKNPSVVVVNDKGEVEARVGRKGEGPGEFLFPLDIALDDEYLYVMDAKSQRLHLFNIQSLAFVKSYMTMDGRSLLVEEDRFVMGAPNILNDTSLHWFSKNGILLKHTLKIPKIAKDHNLITSDIAVDSDGQGHIYAINQMEYKIHKLTAAGKPIKTFQGNHRNYIPPPETVFKNFQSRKKTNQWVSTWTHLHKLAISKRDQVLYVGMITWEPAYNAIDAYDLEGNFLGGWKTGAFQFLNVDQDGTLYFIEERDDPVDDVFFRIHRANLNLKTGSQANGQ